MSSNSSVQKRPLACEPSSKRRCCQLALKSMALRALCTNKTHPIGTLLQRSRGVVCLRRSKRRHASPEDARFLPRNLGQRMAQQLAVVVVQGGDRGGYRGGDDVGGVKAAAKTDLQHHSVNALLHKDAERKEREEPAGSDSRVLRHSGACGVAAPTHA